MNPYLQRKPDYGHQVSTRFSRLELRQLDALVERAKEREGTYPRKSRSSVILALISREAAGLKLSPAERDERQLEMLEARSPLQADVDRVAKASKQLERAAAPSPKRKARRSPLSTKSKRGGR